MRPKHFASIGDLQLEAIRAAIVSEEELVRCYLDSTGVYGEMDRLDSEGYKAVKEALARIRDWKRYIHERFKR